MLDPIYQTFVQSVHQGMRVLDIGSGDGRHTQPLIDAGASVFTVDSEGSELEGATHYHGTVQEYLAEFPDTKFDAVMLKNVVQFLSPNAFRALAASLGDRLEKNGLVYVQTFFAQPDPGFAEPVPSLFTIEDVAAAFARFQVIEANEREVEAKDLHDTQRTFFLTDVLLQKK